MSGNAGRDIIAAVRHPSTTRMFKKAALRWVQLQREHREICDRLWAGTIASNFTASEIALLTDYLSPRDQQLLASVKRFSE